MFETKTITLPKDMSLKQQISEVARQLREWVHSFGKQHHLARNGLRLVEVEQTHRERIFHYSVRFVEDSAVSTYQTRSSPTLYGIAGIAEISHNEKTTLAHLRALWSREPTFDKFDLD
jgi:hypothetical protein